MKSARLYALGLGASYALFALLASGSGARAARELVVRELATASWVVGGLVALSLATNLEKLDVEHGVEALLAQRGATRETLSWARFYVGARRIARLVGLSALAVCAAALLRVKTSSDALALAALTVASLGYALALGVVVSALARGAVALAPERGRTLFVAFIALPHAARALFPELPSVPATFDALLRLVSRAGGLAP